MATTLGDPLADARRQSIVRELRANSEALADLYESAALLLYGVQLPGWARLTAPRRPARRRRAQQ